MSETVLVYPAWKRKRTSSLCGASASLAAKITVHASGPKENGAALAPSVFMETLQSLQDIIRQ
jgi:hypothetical protein